MKTAIATLASIFLFLSAASHGQALTCADLDGAYVVSQEPTPTYLGFFGSQYASESIENPYGVYGSQYSVLSVHDTFGTYGSQFSVFSATDPYTTTPPIVFSGDTAIALLTVNPYLQGGVSLDVVESSCTFFSSAPGGSQAPPPVVPVNLDQHGITGTWRNPAAPGQGMVIDVAADTSVIGQGVLFAGWYTYDVTASGGQRWYSLQATVSVDQPAPEFSIYRTVGGAFDSAQPPTTVSIGQAQLLLIDCNDALLAYTFSDGTGRSGVIPLQRLLPNVTCALDGDSGAPMGSYELSGTWSDPAAKGQGLLMELNPIQGVFFAGWYTYVRNASPNGGPSAQRWFSLQGAIGNDPTLINNIGIYATSGGAFDAPNSTTTVPVGSAQLQFFSCTSAVLTFAFTSGENAGQSGVLNLGRVLPAPNGCG